MSENIFEKQDQKTKAEYERLGLGDLDRSTAQVIRSTALREIREMNITDEAEKLKVYQDVKQHYLKYCEKEHATNISEKPDEIAQLKEQVQELDERLQKLEKYAQE